MNLLSIADLSKLLKINKPIVNVDYELDEKASKQLEKVVANTLKRLKIRPTR